MLKKSFFIVVPTILVIVLIFVFGIQLYNNSYSEFQKDGYVIDTEVQKKVFFSENDKYKIVEKSGYVEFGNSKEEKKVSDVSFVHYVDGSISTFKKAVFLDLDTINKGTYQYYNIFPTSILSNVSDGYRITYLENNLNIKNILMKISSTKYLVAADKIEVALKNGNTKIFENTFLEISYLDGNIIRLDNQEISIQSVSSELILKLNNNVSIDLVNKRILYKNEVKMNLGEITINSDDNIEIVQSEENTTIIDEGKKEKEEKKLPKITDGRITVNPNDGVEEIVDENAKVKEAVFSILDFEVDANSLKTNIYIEDTDGILTGSKTIQVIKSGTNEIIYNENDSTGRTSIMLDVETLSPDTNYTLIVNQSYVKNNIEFNKDFVQKAFVTSSLGIEVNKDYARENELGIIVNKKSFSNVSSLTYSLSTISGEEIKNGSVQFDYGNETLLKFQDLNSNTKYKFTITNFLYGNILVGDGYKEEYIFTTLKKKPTVGTSSFSIDKQNSKFVLSLNNIKDQDNGITSYRADIYENGNSIMTKSALPSSKIDIIIDDVIITRHTDYRAYMYLVFNDNEKEYEIPIGSNVMNMNASNRGPIVRFVSDEITWERIIGNIYIEDKDETIDNTEDVIVTYQNLTISTDARVLKKHNLEKSGDEEYILPVDVNDLKANDTYLFTVKALVNYNDENGYVLADIGQFLVQTAKPKKMAAEFTEDDSKTEAFNVKMRLKSFNTAEDTSLEASTMDSVTIKLYKSGFDTSTQCIASNGCWSTTLYDDNKKDYESTLKDELYFPNTNDYYNITPDTLNINTDDLEYAIYNLEITDAKDYTSFKNDLPIVNNTFSLTPSNIQVQVINNNAPLKITPIKNNGANEELNNNTYIGYTLTPNLLLTQDMELQLIRISAYNATTSSKLFDVIKNPSSNQDLNVTVLFNGEKGFVRGGAYYFTYTVNVLFNGEVVEYNSERSIIIMPPKEEPNIDIYLVTRDNNNSYWKYIIKDIDDALLDNSLYYYFGTGNHEQITILKNRDDYSIIEIPTINGRLNMYYKVSLNEKNADEEFDLVSFYFAPIINNLSSIDYSVSTNVNQAIISLDLDDSVKNNFLFADVDFYAGSETVSLEKLSVDSKKIYVDLYKIKKLKGLENINCIIKLYYDSNIYGLENSGLSVFQASNEQYVSIDSNLFFTYNVFNPNTRKISINVLGVDKDINYASAKGYVVYNSTMGMFKKMELNSSENVHCSENCSFSFEAITPSFSLKNDNIAVNLFSVSIKPTVSNYDEETSDSMIVHAVLRKQVDGVCSDNIDVSKNIPLYAFDSPYLINGLERDTNYCLNFYWSDNHVSNQKFYYTDVNSYNNTYTFKTLSNVNIDGIDVKYAITSSGIRGRYLNISYRVGVTSGYSGIKYKVKASATNEEVIDSTYSLIDEIASFNGNIQKYIDISEKLNAEKKYYVEIVPYVIVNGVENEFGGISKEFVLKIDSPKIVFTRLTDLAEDSLSFKINIRDSSNALNRYRTYDLYFKDEMSQSSETTLIDSNISVSNVNKQFTISCPSKRCSAIVKYREDTGNTGNYVEKQAKYIFNLSETFLLGEVTIVQTNDNSIIRLSFIGSYNLKSITRLIYTIVDENGAPVAVRNIDDLNFVVDSENNDYVYLDINENLNPGKYQLVLQFLNGETGEVTSVDLSYIKT